MGRSETCPSLKFFLFPWEVTLMLKVSWLATVAYFVAGMFSKAEGMNWS